MRYMVYLREEEQAAISLQTPVFWMLWVEWCGPSGDSCSWDALLASLCSVRIAYGLSTSLGTLATSSDLCPSQPFALSQHPTPTLFVTCQHPTGVAFSKMARHGLDQSLSFPSLGFHIYRIPWVLLFCFLVIPLALSLFNVWSLQNVLPSHTTLWGKCCFHMGNGSWERRGDLLYGFVAPAFLKQVCCPRPGARLLALLFLAVLAPRPCVMVILPCKNVSFVSPFKQQDMVSHSSLCSSWLLLCYCVFSRNDCVWSNVCLYVLLYVYIWMDGGWLDGWVLCSVILLLQ